jgi:hypothetical protein
MQVDLAIGLTCMKYIIPETFELRIFLRDIAQELHATSSTA